MKKIRVNLRKYSYDIQIERGILEQAGERMRQISGAEKAAVITDDTVNALYGDRLEESMKEAGFAVRRISFPAGETSKTLSVLDCVYGELADFGMTRSDLAVTLGGGVPGDLGGFAAATYLRGIPLVQIPTSFLAQIDSSVGGKVAVDLPMGKNLVGSFYQPAGVLIDPDLISSLPVRYLHDGMAEAVKYGCIKSIRLFELLERIQDREEMHRKLEQIIYECCMIKARIVERDEYDLGERMQLNFGHTLGHAAEAFFHYETYTHGEGVAVGMSMVTEMSEKQGLTQPGTAARLETLLKKFELPIHTEAPLEDLLALAEHDKKKRGDDLTLIILSCIGEARPLRMHFADFQKFMKGEMHEGGH